MARPPVNPTHNTSNIARSLYAQCNTTWRSRLCYLPYFTDEIHNSLYALGELVVFQIQAPSSPMRTVETGKLWLTLAGIPEPIYLVSLQWLKTGSYESCASEPGDVETTRLTERSLVAAQEKTMTRWKSTLKDRGIKVIILWKAEKGYVRECSVGPF